jgi:bacteriophage N4 adsorption protein B
VSLDRWVVVCLVPLVAWILLSGLDDLFVIFVSFLPGTSRFRWPRDEELARESERRIAILVPLWREDGVIERMLERNLAVIRYRKYDIFTGVYPNDARTRGAVRRITRRHSRVHIAVNSRSGPTSKGDCLNHAYRSMQEYEAARGFRYEIVMLHDAEDLIHPDSLRLVNYYSRHYQMVQVPVLPLATGIAELTHGAYCDEFAESQLKDIPVRRRLGGFLPSCGVGTAFDRDALDRIGEERNGLVFDPASLTEDYEAGLRLHAMGCRQIFLPLRMDADGPVATREFFPRNFRAAARQRSRWVAGIALQGWERHGWRTGWRQAYWLWRDRKGLVGNLLSPVANLIFLYGLGSFLAAAWNGHPWPLAVAVPSAMAHLCRATFAVSLAQTAVRMRASARVYGWRFAALAPARAPWANLVNCAATLAALSQYIGARRARRALIWRKTEHVYPHDALPGYSRATFSEQA